MAALLRLALQRRVVRALGNREMPPGVRLNQHFQRDLANAVTRLAMVVCALVPV
jgi:hypothetical protein